MAKYRILPDFEKCAHIVFEQKLLFTAVAVNSSRICFDRTGHLMEGEGGVSTEIAFNGIIKIGARQTHSEITWTFYALTKLVSGKTKLQF